MKNLKGRRITLVPPRKEYASEMILEANDKAVARFTHMPHPYTQKHFAAFIKKSSSSHKKNKKKEDYAYLIVSNPEKKLLGGAGLHKINYKDSNAELGYWIAKSARGQGYAKEAADLLLNFGFNHLNLNRICLNCLCSNKASKKVIKKLGAKYEGIARKKVKINGEYHDEYTHSLLKSEYNQLKKTKTKK